MNILPCAKRWNFPSVDLSTRMVRTCCRAYGPVATREDVRTHGKNIFLNHPYMQKGRELMLKGEYQFDCRTCYETPDGFQTSYPETLRQLAGPYGETESELAENFAKKSEDPRYLESLSARELEVSFGNACDLMCVYCSSTYSSLIEAEDRKFQEPPSPFTQSAIEKNEDFLEAFWQWLVEDALKSITSIHLIGGETLFNDYLQTFLTRLDDGYKRTGLGNTIYINIFSNLNNNVSVKRFTDSVLKLHPNFRLRLLFSNEALGSRAEFIRHGTDWNRTVANLRLVLDVDRIELGFAPSFNSLSVSSIPDYLKFLHELHQGSGKKFYCGDNYIPFPHAYSPFILTKDFVPYVDQGLAFLKTRGAEFLLEESILRVNSFLSTLRQKLMSNDDEAEDLRLKRLDFLRKMKTLIRRRNVDFAGTFPEYEKFCSLCEYLETH